MATLTECVAEAIEHHKEESGAYPVEVRVSYAEYRHFVKSTEAKHGTSGYTAVQYDVGGGVRVPVRPHESVKHQNVITLSAPS